MTDEPRPKKFLLCTNRRFRTDSASCAQRGSEAFADRIEAEVARRGLNVTVERINCLGQCNNGAAMRLAPGGKFYLGVKEADLDGIIEELEAACGFAEKPGAKDEPDSSPKPDELPLHLLGS